MKKSLVKKIKTNVKQSYNNIAADFARTRQRSWPEVEEICGKYVKPNWKILDAGCGNGRLVQTLADLDIPLEYYGLDTSRELLGRAWEQYGLQYKKVKIIWQEGDLLELPQQKNYFDAVFAIASVHHLPSTKLRQQSLQEFRRVLRRGGRLIMANWNLFTWAAFYKYKLWWQLFNIFKGYDWGDFMIPWKNTEGEVATFRYYHSFNQVELNKLLKRSGFKLNKLNLTKVTLPPQSVAKSIITLAIKN